MSKSLSLYIPKKGDIIWLNFNPQLGREQSGHGIMYLRIPLYPY